MLNSCQRAAFSLVVIYALVVLVIVDFPVPILFCLFGLFYQFSNKSKKQKKITRRR